VVTNAIPLQNLPAGHSASILRILGRPDDVHRLEEFGIRCGTKIEMFRAGTPCILRIAGNKFCLRADELMHVFVEPIAAMIHSIPKKTINAKG
jgi:Fe2+ transport system protein FeoA